ncbi:MAG TPA: hypothetical protein VKU00_07955 [Chthonomonadaceae bacterium]|nr:hypothetical protein [Chthonomonadaceae bacterium]
MWKPLSETALLRSIEDAEWQMEPPLRAFWDRIKIPPQKWRQTPWGDAGGGFWVVAIIGRECVYYNDIEDGFNTSPYVQWGQIEEYWCNQPDLLAFVTAYHQDFLQVLLRQSGKDRC